MPISLSEDLLSLPAAAGEFPGRPHCSTVWRYATRGIGGNTLETIRVGGKVFTSREACRRFIARCNGQSLAPDRSRKATAKRRAEIKAAERRVSAAGL